ncbi:uncharacterized protein LOC141687424 [Apium graveolens]|uniref:uncharacterized protein LOC141687424 n=1 Tax=Apium graveolens TaxID=4045 RepID=UPI003D7B56D2
MALKDIIFDGAKFVPNNYATFLTKSEAPSELHFIKDFLSHSEIGFALTQPFSICGTQVLTFWRTGHYDYGGKHGTPSIVFTANEVEYVVTPGAVRKALHLPESCQFSSAVEEPLLQQMMANLGYEQSLAKLGQLKRPYIRKEWSFFFNCITKTFANKCSNFDAIPILTQQIGYALLNLSHFDYAKTMLCFIGDRMKEDKNVVYFARFCQLIYNYCTSDEPKLAGELMEPFRLAKRAFTDLFTADNKKGVLRPLCIPLSVKQALLNVDAATYSLLYPDVQPTNTQQPSAPTPATPQTQTSAHANQSSAPTMKPSSSRAKRIKSVPQTKQNRRRMILRDESEDEAQVHTSEPVAKQLRKCLLRKLMKLGVLGP